ncbi:MAG: hypothetical protein ABGX22_28470 [Pirellulaceae bacterium]|nr:hypothetical protein [Planctomycetaceae bacterium]
MDVFAISATERVGEVNLKACSHGREPVEYVYRGLFVRRVRGDGMCPARIRNAVGTTLRGLKPGDGKVTLLYF